MIFGIHLHQTQVQEPKPNIAGFDRLSRHGLKNIILLNLHNSKSTIGVIPGHGTF